MSFAFELSLKNIKRRPFRAAAMAALVMFLTFSIFAGAFTVISLQNGLEGYRARLGADIVVIPNSAKGHGSVDDILLQGITGAYYMSGKDIEKICAVEGVESVSKQFFLTSAKASCCSSRVQIIGIDPKTDLTVMPWIAESFSGEIGDGDVMIGADVSLNESKTVKFYGEDYRVAARLEKTGTGLDSAVYTNMATIRKMAKDASSLLETDAFKGVDINTAASAVFIKVADGYEISEVADDINILITKVEATPARSMVSDISDGLSKVSGIIGALVAVVWALAVVILAVVFALLSNERKKEFAVLRVMGAPRKMLFSVMCFETALTSLVGAVAGLAVAAAVVFPLSDTLKASLGLPFLMPRGGTVALLGAGAVIISLLAGVATASLSAGRITHSETGLLLREDA